MNDIDIDAPIGDVFSAILDVGRVATCVPGASVISSDGDSHVVSIKVRIGPVSMTYKGELVVLDRDAQQHRAAMQVTARETRGQGTARATVEMRLTGDAAHTHGTIDSDVELSGKAAAMGQGAIRDVSAKLIDTFAANLTTMLAVPAQPAERDAPAPSPRASAPAAVDALPIGGLVADVTRERLGRHRGAIARAALVVGLILVARRVAR